MSLIVLPAVWIATVLLAMTPMYWALGEHVPRESFTRSGSSLLTLGFAYGHDGPDDRAHASRAPPSGSAWSPCSSPTCRRSTRSSPAVRSWSASSTPVPGTPPDPAELLLRALRIGWLEQLDDLWVDWERWFVEVEESHTSNASLPFFRSQHPERSWLTAAGCVLDTAALRASVLDLPRTYKAELCLRSGYLALRHLADLFDIDYDHEPAAGRPDLDRPARSSTRSASAWPPRARRCGPTGTRPGGTSRAGGSTTTARCSCCARWWSPPVRAVVERPRRAGRYRPPMRRRRGSR